MEALLRKTIPRPLLRKGAIFLNRIKTNTFDRIFFSTAEIDRKDFLVFNEYRALPELSGIIKNNHDPLVNKGLEQFVSHTENEFILHYKKDCLIEPKHGWAVSNKTSIIRASLGNSDAPHLKAPALKYISPRYKRIVRLKRAISLRDSSERAYFHFYNDVIAKIPFLLHHGINISCIPIIVSATTFHRPFFQELLQRSRLMASLNWKLQTDEVFHCEETYFCKPGSLNKEIYDWTVKEFNFPEQLYGKTNKTFITRNPIRLRYINNMEEIIPLLTERGFDIIDTDRLTVFEQSMLLASTRYLAAIHGAGLTNMIFRSNHPLNILEIFPPTNVVPYHYAVLAKRYGYKYAGITGNGFNSIKGSFNIDPGKFEHALVNMLNS